MIEHRSTETRSNMTTDEMTRNKLTFGRFHDALNTGDADIISKTIDELGAIPA
jgi:hypothetical protein